MTINVTHRTVIRGVGETRPGHEHWLKIHPAEDVDPNEKIQSAYTRSNGTRVVPTVKRPYPKLKNKTPIEEMK
jgi:hypothetical protein